MTWSFIDTLSMLHRSLGHFLTNVCSIVGGIFTVTGILYSFLDSSIHAIRKKMELGKFS